MDAEEILHEFIYIDEAGFNLTKARRRGRNVIGHRAIINVPGQHGGNISLCAAISHDKIGPYNTPHILAFLDRLSPFHRSALVQNWFQHHCWQSYICTLIYTHFWSLQIIMQN